MTTLTHAHREWATRPDDESYATVAALHAATLRHREMSVEQTVPQGMLRALATPDGEVRITKGNGDGAHLTHWSFGQFARLAGAPADYLRKLPAPLAVQCLEAGWTERPAADDANLLFERNGSLTVRSITSDSYTRFWNSDVSARLLRLEEQGPWQPAPAAADGKRGLYASDRNMFAFMVDNNRRVFEKAPGGGFSRGFFCWNSEVGDGSIGHCTFLYSFICGNHLVWDASQVRETRLRHVGRVNDRFESEWAATLVEYADASASADEARIEKTRQYVIAGTKDEVLDKLFGLRIPALTRKRLDAAYDIAVQREDWYGNPHSAFGMANGLTEFSQTVPFADERTAIDRAAGKVLALAW